MRIAAFALASLAIGQPALGQSQAELETGSRIGVPLRARIPDSTRLTGEQAAQVTMNRYMACVVQRQRGKAERYVALPSGSPEARALVPVLASYECLDSGELRFQPRLMRGGIYEALYRADFGRLPPGDLSARAPVTYVAVGEDDPQRAALLAFGDCVSRADAKGSHALLLSAPAGKAEGDAIAALMPALNACLSQGATVRFSRPSLRGVVAETTYRIAKAPVAAAPPAASPSDGGSGR